MSARHAEQAIDLDFRSLEGPRMAASPLLTPSTACEYLRCSERTLRRLVAERRLPAVRIRSRVMFLQSDLDAFLVSARSS